ncbi:aldehyde dehydrogenase [Bacillaceae bacterium S4-13-56]
MKNVNELLERQKRFFYSEKTKTLDFRLQQLDKLKDMIANNEAKIMEALKKDLNKSEFEAFTTEIGFLYMELKEVRKKLRSWMEPEKVTNPITHKGAKSRIYKDPYGVALVIAPWNYPFQLALAPVIGAIAAGNCVILKPSELTPNVSRLLAELVAQYFNEEYFTVVEGAVKETQELLSSRVDYIFFTGSVRVGKIVMEKASKYLTPHTLELGGKSPTIVDHDANLEIAAKRIAWAKFTNAGQTCIAPDYLFVHEKVKEQFIDLLKKSTEDLYGNALKNPDYGRIVSDGHYERLKSFLLHAKVLFGGNSEDKELIIEPTFLGDIGWDDPVMQEEIFGPLLPVLTFTSIETVIEQVRNHEKPLALYYFSESKEKQEKILTQLTFGGGCINDALFHIANPYLPFGGVGQSGTGAYHGKASFDTFTHQKSVVHQTTKFDFPFRYPGNKQGIKLIKKLMRP